MQARTRARTRGSVAALLLLAACATSPPPSSDADVVGAPTKAEVISTHERGGMEVTTTRLTFKNGALRVLMYRMALRASGDLRLRTT